VRRKRSITNPCLRWSVVHVLEIKLTISIASHITDHIWHCSLVALPKISAEGHSLQVSNLTTSMGLHTPKQDSIGCYTFLKVVHVQKPAASLTNTKFTKYLINFHLLIPENQITCFIDQCLSFNSRLDRKAYTSLHPVYIHQTNNCHA
jgi:hypothetical protein